MMAVYMGILVLASVMQLVQTLPAWRKRPIIWLTLVLLVGGGFGTFTPYYGHLEHGDAAAASALVSIRASGITLAVEGVGGSR